MQETQEMLVESLSQEDSLEEEMAIHSVVLPGKSHGVRRARLRKIKKKKKKEESCNCCRWLSGKESTCQCRRHRFDSWTRKIPWRRIWQSTPVFLPAESHGPRNLECYTSWVAKSQTWLSDWACWQDINITLKNKDYILKSHREQTLFLTFPPFHRQLLRVPWFS